MNTLEILKKLVTIPSFVDRNVDESEIAKYIKRYFLNLKYPWETQVVEEKRQNVICGNTKNPKIVLLGHMDTVLPKQQASTPLVPKVIGDRLYGLGAVDMKSGIAIMMSLAAKITSDKIAYVFTCDEEYKFYGSLKLLEKYKWKPDLIINTEPTGVSITNGCRGITEFSFDVYGKSAHASRKYLGVNAIEKTILLTQMLERRLQKFDKEIKTSLNLSALEGGVLQTLKNNVPYISKLGMNVPDFARVNCEIRIGNSEITEQKIKRLLNRLARKENVKIKSISFKFFLGMFLTPKERLQKFERAIKQKNSPVVYRDINTAGFYEIQMLREAWNCDAIVFGPGPIEAAHAASEYVNLSSIDKVESILEGYLANMLK